MAAYLLRGGEVFTQGELRPADVLIRDGAIARIGEGLESGGAEVIDCAGKTVLPGLVDLHVHFRQPGFEYKETILTGSRAAARGGFTTVCTMPNLDPVPDSLEHLKKQLEIIERDAVINVLPFGSITVNEKGKRLSDIEDMAPYVAGFSDDGKGVQSRELMGEAMERVRACGSFISAHCEDESLLEGGSVHKGSFARMWGLRGISSESEYAQIDRDIKLAAETGVRYHVCHISAKESIELVRKGKARGVSVTCEVTPHHIALCDMDISENSGRFKMNPPLRDESDRRAIRQGLKDGTIDAIATDHAPHSVDEKSKGIEGSAFGTVGSETAFAVCYTMLVKGGVIGLGRLVELMTSAPAAILGREAELKPGARADIAVFDLEKRFTVDIRDFLSMGKSTPFEGAELYGETYMTICGGEIVYGRDKLGIQ